MRFRRRYLWALALGLGAWQSGRAHEPARLGLDDARTPLCQPQSANQRLAGTVAAQLKQSGQLKGYKIDVLCQGGAVELTGFVADQMQREEALRIVQGVPGVERVLDRMTLRSATAIQRTQATDPPPISTGPVPGAPTSNGGVEPPPGPPAVGTGPTLGAPGGAPPPGGTLPTPTPGGMPEPMPIFQAQPGAAHGLNPPAMPPYAWPSFAPYNNFSRVATPLAYPQNAWPYIGPVHPFPKVPLGWRSVRLEWQDGHWWFSKTATKHDWWRLRYW